jgi:hypothetical protein
MLLDKKDFKMRLSRISPFVIAGAALLAGCDAHPGRMLGKNLPDETQVVDGPSLALPPSFELRPPREAQDYEALLRQQKTLEAESLITGVSASQVTTFSDASSSVPNGDVWLVKQVSTQSGVVADPNVRSELDAAAKTDEATKETSAQKSKKGLFKRWFGSSDDE